MIKSLRCISLVLLFSPFVLFGQSAIIENDLFEKLEETDRNTEIPIILLLKDAVDVETLKAGFVANNVPVKERPRLVMRALKEKAGQTQPTVLSTIARSGYSHQNVTGFWISNSIALHAVPDLIALLSELEEVERIGLNLPQFSLITPAKGSATSAKSLNGHEPGHDAIHAPEMWAMGYSGHGRIAMTYDTGVWPEHPAISSRFLPNLMPLMSTWYAYDSELPSDKSSSHGTHVTGIMAGLDVANSDTIGVAPAAYIIATDPIVSNLADIKPLSDLMLGYEWSLNPDGDELTSSDVPDVINNSWGRNNEVTDQGWTVCPEFVIPVFNAVLAAGIANVFSAGNEGPDPMTIGVPHNINTGLVNSFTVAAVNGNVAGPNYPVAEFSSRGPSLCGGEGSILIKPEVSAPGVNVRSSVGNGEYDLFSGTSMAAPHTSGAVLLLKEAFPYLSGEDIMLALYFSASDLGAAGEDNTYGMGMINVKAAFDYLSIENVPVAPATLTNDVEISSIDYPNTPTLCAGNLGSIAPIVSIRNKGVETITGITLHYDINGTNEMLYQDESLELAPDQTVQLTLEPIALSTAGNQELHVWTDTLTGEYDLFNNHRTIRWRQLPLVNIQPSISFTEAFDNGFDPNLWTVQNPDNSITWDTISVIQSDGNYGTVAWIDFAHYNLLQSQHDYLISPVFNCSCEDSNIGSALMTFDLFFRKRTSNDFQKDTLAIFVEQQCGTFEAETTEIFRKGGDDLFTVFDSQSNAFPENEDQWENIEVSFPLVNAQDPVFYISFESTNRRGNNLLIDNVNISLAIGTGLNEKSDLAFEIYPNPANGSFYLSGTGLQNADVSLFDISGRAVKKFSQIQDQAPLNISNLSAGIYFVKVKLDDGEEGVARLVIY